ncbi:membrane-spanning 4-domains subfamily A member 8 isoform X3 [Oryctolagus cuniculus]|uniref:membrane-spanning 4-domains subfamily A member 8 isoform X3 n=1 Tax=Oryctolagus cuniculus TaxID=9986 RepID=UPI003879B8BF
MVAEEIRTFGAIQVMIGLINFALGYIWIRLFIRQYTSFSLTYIPLTLFSGYPFWASLIYVISGIFAIEAEKKRYPILLEYTIRMSINSVALSVAGQLIILFEITLFLVKHVKSQWSHQSGIILSVYLWMFSLVELILAKKVAKWGIKTIDNTSYNI